MQHFKHLSIWIIALVGLMISTTGAQAADKTPPTAGSYVSGYPKAISPTQIEVKWTKGTDNVTSPANLRYRIMWKKSGGTWVYSHDLDNLPKDITSYTITGLEPNTEYVVDVSVRDEADNGKFYGEKSASTDKTPPTPGGYRGGYPKAISPTQIKVQWASATDNVTPQDKLRYKVWWKKSSSDGWTYSHPDNNLPKDMTEYTIENLEPNTEYVVDVYVKDVAGNGEWYGERTVKTPKSNSIVTRPNTPPTPGSYGTITATTNTITVNWTKATDNETSQDKLEYSVGYQTVEEYNNSDQPYGTTFKTNITTEIITGLTPDTEYVIWVDVFDGKRSARYGEKRIKTQAAGGSGSTTVAVASITLNRTSITINADRKEVQLTATVAPASATDKSLKWTSGNTDVATVDGSGLVTILKKGKSVITATANDGSGAYAECKIEVVTTVGNESVEGTRLWTSDGALHLSLPTPGMVHIYNVSGALVKRLALPAGTHTEPLSAGFYVVRLADRTEKAVIK